MPRTRPQELLVERAAEINDLVQRTAWQPPGDLEGRQRLHRAAKHGAALFDQVAELALMDPDPISGGAQSQ